jgi:hypothetical protein
VIRLGSLPFLLCAAAMLHVSPAAAQSPAPRPFRFEAGIGVSWMGREPIGTRSATETTGAGGTSPLFNTSSELAGAAGLDGRIGVRLSRSLVAEVEASYLKPQLRIAISADAEGAAAVTASETVQQFTIGGNIRWMLPGRWWSSRLAPFALGGGGYMRQLHDQATLLETGRCYHLGAGVETLLASGRRFHTRGVGARAEVRALIRSKGVAFDTGSKTSPAAAVSAFVRF